jgi:hypothetical protein
MRCPNMLVLHAQRLAKHMLPEVLPKASRFAGIEITFARHSTQVDYSSRFFSNLDLDKERSDLQVPLANIRRLPRNRTLGMAHLASDLQE